MKQALAVQHWIHDKNWLDSLMLLESRPTINIEGLVAGYTGPGGKTVLPHRAVAKLDMRLVPDMTAADTLAKLKAHLAKHGFADIEVNDAALRNAIACIVEQAVEPAEPRRSAFDQRLQLGFVSNVGLHETGRLAKPLRECLASIATTTGDDDGCALLDEQLSRSSTDTTGATGDDRDFPVKNAH